MPTSRSTTPSSTVATVSLAVVTLAANVRLVGAGRLSIMPRAGSTTPVCTLVCGCSVTLTATTNSCVGSPCCRVNWNNTSSPSYAPDSLEGPGHPLIVA